MQELEKILEEIDQRVKYYRDNAAGECVDICFGLREAEELIRKHMNDVKCGECSRRKWYQKGYKDGKSDNGSWILLEDGLPEDRQEVLCCDGEYVYLIEHEDDAPFGDLDDIVAWQPLPEPYHPERRAE